MNYEQLVAKQALELHELKTLLSTVGVQLGIISNGLYCIGAPLNDNALEFNKEQRRYLQHAIDRPLEEAMCLMADHVYGVA